MTNNISDDRLLFTILDRIEVDINKLKETSSDMQDSGNRLSERILRAEIALDAIKTEIALIAQTKDRNTYFNTVTSQHSKTIRLIKKILKYFFYTLLFVLAFEFFIAHKAGYIGELIKILSFFKLPL